MATSYGVLGQTADASTEVTLYTVAPAKNVKIKVTITNRSTAATFRLALVPDGGATANEDYVAYDKPLPANDSLTSTIFTLNASDVVRVESSTATVTFIISGIEQDVV